MSTMKSILQEFHQQLPTLKEAREGELLFEELLISQGFQQASNSDYSHLEREFTDPLHMSYPKCPRSDRWFIRRPFERSSTFLLTLNGNVFPFDVKVTKNRRNPSWGHRIVPSIGARICAELETPDSTVFLCGPFTHRSEKKALKELEQEYETLVSRLSNHSGIQKPYASLVYIPDQDHELIYESPRRAGREMEAKRLMEYLEGISSF